MGEVVQMKGLVTKLRMPVEIVLKQASDTKWKEVLFLGYDENGDIDAMMSSGTVAETLLLLERAKSNIILAPFGSEIND